jgi:hypothetical protein
MLFGLQKAEAIKTQRDKLRTAPARMLLPQKGRRSSQGQISSWLEHAQAIAALNCQFEGPRGGMYQLSKSKFLQSVAALEAKKPGDPKQKKISLSQQLSTAEVCPSCSPKDDHRPKLGSERFRHATRVSPEN